jgi:uncharacterized protein YeaO (DUF488 family)
MIRIKRIYEPAGPDDGFRVLCTRHWPRGVKRTAVENWWPELGTTSDLLKPWLAGELAPEVFRAGMLASLAGDKARQRLRELAEMVRRGEEVTLLTSVKDLDCTHLVIVREVIEQLAAGSATD